VDDHPSGSRAPHASELGFALALILVVLAEGAIVHFLLPAGWFWPKVVLAAVQLYGLSMLIAWALGPRLYPHRLSAGMLELRLGQLYVGRVAVELIEHAEARIEKLERGAAHWREGEVLLSSRGRVDVRLVLNTPIEVERPLGEPVTVSTISIAVDDPRGLIAELEQRRMLPPASAAHETGPLMGWLVPVADLLA